MAQQEYILMNKRTPVLSYTYNTFLRRVERVNEVFDIAAGPLWTQRAAGRLTGPDLAYALQWWWEERRIPTLRSGLRQSLRRLYEHTPEMPDRDIIEELLLINHALSLSDQYWVRDTAATITWDEINYFTNDFTDDMGRAMFSRAGRALAAARSLMSPTATTDGMMVKAWRIRDGKRLLYKKAPTDNPRVAYNEVAASALYRRVFGEAGYVQYHVVTDDDGTYAVSENMVSDNEELVAAIQIRDYFGYNYRGLATVAYENYLMSALKLGVADIETHMSKMLVCDYLLANTDRHYNNFGLIRNVETLKFTRPAPVFDTGNSLNYADGIEKLARGEATFEQLEPFGVAPAAQLDILQNVPWYETGLLDGIVDEIGAILKPAYNLSPTHRRALDTVLAGVGERVATLGKHVGRQISIPGRGLGSSSPMYLEPFAARAARARAAAGTGREKDSGPKQPPAQYRPR
ncbi:MAG: hypothetical protein LBS17_03485 [Actinomycetes bacterium]|nr:hypothetical protein [Actinomycetes bacterium]